MYIKKSLNCARRCSTLCLLLLFCCQCKNICIFYSTNSGFKFQCVYFCDGQNIICAIFPDVQWQYLKYSIYYTLAERGTYTRSWSVIVVMNKLVNRWIQITEKSMFILNRMSWRKYTFPFSTKEMFFFSSIMSSAMPSRNNTASYGQQLGPSV